ncbi:unnamed protein product [Zymoseptoria tritici ST99CH_1E4]|uniref:Uncharacterized protein n=1 Tax=Zymoseptoria tritici ST99CH_1E4 TaxID=1276532 RepID=A0A2H1H9K5_ZYMTR|nr:unnamed protein product [Zymoseptoria tritici ST99CH_1E4]
MNRSTPRSPTTPEMSAHRSSSTPQMSAHRSSSTPQMSAHRSSSTPQMSAHRSSSTPPPILLFRCRHPQIDQSRGRGHGRPTARQDGEIPGSARGQPPWWAISSFNEDESEEVVV